MAASYTQAELANLARRAVSSSKEYGPSRKLDTWAVRIGEHGAITLVTTIKYPGGQGPDGKILPSRRADHCTAL